VGQPPAVDPRGCRHPVVVFLNAIGDSILALPALRALASLFPGQVTLVCDDHPYRFIFRELALRSTVCVRDRAVTSFPWEAVAAQIPECDLMISLATWQSADMDRLLSRLRPRVSIGFTPPFDIVVQPDPRRHMSEIMLDAVRVLSPELALAPLSTPLQFSPDAMRAAAEMRTALPPGSRLLAVHAETQAHKRWDAERCAGAIRTFLDRHADFWCCVMDRSPDVVTSCAHPRVMQESLPLEVAQCVVAQADLFVGIDSCFLHVADVNRVPSVGLFGPTSPERWGFLHTAHRTLRTAGCETSGIGPLDVVTALEELIGTRRPA
jgi:ADP-heptose:LPS heptosyltransferase